MSSASNNPIQAKRSAWRRLRDDRSGVAALEFALVLLPFVLLMVGTMEIGRYFFTVQSLRTMVANAARMAMIDGTLASVTAIPAGTGTNCSNTYALTNSLRDTVIAATPFLDGTVKVCINNPSGTGARTVLVKASYTFSSVIPQLPVNMTITDQTTLTFIR